MNNNNNNNIDWKDVYSKYSTSSSSVEIKELNIYLVLRNKNLIYKKDDFKGISSDELFSAFDKEIFASNKYHGYNKINIHILHTLSILQKIILVSESDLYELEKIYQDYYNIRSRIETNTHLKGKKLVTKFVGLASKSLKKYIDMFTLFNSNDNPFVHSKDQVLAIFKDCASKNGMDSLIVSVDNKKVAYHNSSIYSIDNIYIGISYDELLSLIAVHNNNNN